MRIDWETWRGLLGGTPGKPQLGWNVRRVQRSSCLASVLNLLAWLRVWEPSGAGRKGPGQQGACSGLPFLSSSFPSSA